jgi:methylamine dehydrogenase heavy chain
MVPADSHRLYVVDLSFTNMTDARLLLYDGVNHKRLGQIGAGFAPSIAISPDGKTTAVATTYFARGSHGTRTDVVEFYDNQLLTTQVETVIPSKRAQTVPFAYSASYSDDGRFVYVSNITPATSISVVDAANHSFVGEIDMAGCTLAYPDGARRVSALCESGKTLTVTLDDAGKEVKREQSDVLFNVDKDPVFAAPVRGPNGLLLTSFLGNVINVNFTSGKGVATDRWSLVTDQERAQGWRPGGIQPTALHRTLGYLYVAMHKGGEGTHKDPATEIWVFDINSHNRVGRINLTAQKIAPVLSIQISQDPQPQLSALTVTSDLVLINGRTGKLSYTEKQLGATSLLLLNP